MGVLASAIIHKIAARTGKKSALFLIVVLLLVSCMATGLLEAERAGFRALLASKILNTVGFVGLAGDDAIVIGGSSLITAPGNLVVTGQGLILRSINLWKKRRWH